MKRRIKYNIIMSKVQNSLKFQEKIILFLFKNYTYKIYQLGTQQGFNWNNMRYTTQVFKGGNNIG